MKSDTTMIAWRHDERGMTTAEYAVGTVASVSFVGVIISLLSSEEFRTLLWNIIQLIFKIISSFSPVVV